MPKQMSEQIQQSQTSTRAGGAAIPLVFFSLIWDGALFLMYRSAAFERAPLWIWLFPFFGLLITWAAVQQLRERLRGGGAQLTLSQDPVPHGLPMRADFTLDKGLSAERWNVEISLRSSDSKSSGSTHIWSQDFAAQSVMAGQVHCDFMLPAEHPSTRAAQGSITYAMTMTLKGAGASWAFNLATRAATVAERSFALGAGHDGTVKQTGNKYDPSSPEVIKQRQRARWLVHGIGAFAFMSMAWFMFSDFLPAFQGNRERSSTASSSFSAQAKSALGLGAYSTRISTASFPLTINGWHSDNWGVQAKFMGTARINNSVLEMEVSDIAVRHNGSCTDAKNCMYDQVRVLLAQDGSRNFSTLSESEALSIPPLLLAQREAWHSGPKQLSLKLPSALDSGGVWLKLEVRNTNRGTSYIDGPRLQLHAELAKALGKASPCDAINDRREALQAGCDERLITLLKQGPSAFEQAALKANEAKQAALKAAGKKSDDEPLVGSAEDRLLFAALRAGAWPLITPLLQSGANPNAIDPWNPGHTALYLAARSGELAPVEALLAAGAKADLRTTNEHGQETMALSGALRADNALVVSRLLQAGATVKSTDSKGWTPLHIAAYESAVQSLPLLIKAGANVDERTPAYRQQTPLMTALQYADLATAQALISAGADLKAVDNQSKNSCEWAQFFKRDATIVKAACGENAAFQASIK
jgi:hypothetical protein